MILCFLFFCLFGKSMAIDNTTGATGNSISSKSIMCYYKGNLANSSSKLISLDPKDIPCECEIIIYSQFSINNLSVINVDKTFLKSVVDLNKPVIVTILREAFSTDWGTILGPDGNSKEAKLLCDFAKENKIAGYLLEGLAPESLNRPFRETIAQYVVPYIKQLSECSAGFIIGVSIDAHASHIKNTCMFDFAAMNDLVTFYEIETYLLNRCRPKIYNGVTSITKVDHGANYLYGMEEVASFLKESKISLTKIAYDIELFPQDPDATTYTSYSQVCKGEFNCSTWCIQNTKNFYDKGKFALEQNSAIIVKLVDLADDIKNECGCSSTFIGFKNIIAGFRGGSQIACAKYDVQSAQYAIK